MHSQTQNGRPRRTFRRILLAVAVAALAATAACGGGACRAFADEQQVSVTAPLSVKAVLSPADGSISIEGAYVENTGDLGVRMTSVGFEGAVGVGGTWECEAGGTVLFSGPPSPTGQATDVEVGAGERLALDWSTTFAGDEAAPFAGRSLGRISYVFEPTVPPACALLYDDGELVFQRGSAPDAGRSLVASYEGVEDLSIEGSWDTPWFEHLNEVITVTVRDPIAIKDASNYFSGLSNCTSMDLSGLDTSRVTSWERMMNEMFCLREITLGPLVAFAMPDGTPVEVLPTPSPVNIPGADGMWYDSTGAAWKPLDIPPNKAETYTAVKPPVCALLYDDGEFVFQKGSAPDAGRALVASYEGVDNLRVWKAKDIPWYSHLKDVTAVTVRDPIAICDGSYYFYGLSNCTSMDLAKLDTSQMESMLYMFGACSSLAELDLSGFDTSAASQGLMNRTGTFAGMASLRKVTLGALFDFKNANITSPDGYLPVPSPTSIPGADGKWYDSAGTAWDPSGIPSNKAETYTAVPGARLAPAGEPGAGDPTAALPVGGPNAPDWAAEIPAPEESGSSPAAPLAEERPIATEAPA